MLLVNASKNLGQEINIQCLTPYCRVVSPYGEFAKHKYRDSNRMVS